MQMMSSRSKPKARLEERLLQLIQTTGYEMVQSNGQRLFGPWPGWPADEPPPKQAEVFVGRIPRDCFEDELVPLFWSVGRIYMMRLMMDFSGSNRGFGFVTFTNPSDAHKAIKLLNNYEIRPKHRIGVVQSVDNCRLFIGNLPPDLTRKQVFDVFNNYTEGVVGAVVHYNRNGEDINGFAFIEYRSHRDAAMARRKLLPESTLGLFGTELTIDWAIPEPNGDNEIMSKVTVLFVRYLSSCATDELIRHFFSLNNQLNVIRVKRIKDYAFIHYEDRTSAELALNRISDLDLSQSPLTEPGGQPIEVKWSIPPDAHRLQKSLKSRSNNSNLCFDGINNQSKTSRFDSMNIQMTESFQRHSTKSSKNHSMRDVFRGSDPVANTTPKGLIMFWSDANRRDKHWINDRKPRPGLQ